MEKLLKISDVSDMIGYGNTKIDEWVAAGKFPQPIRPHGTGHPRWLLSEVQEWIQEQVKLNRAA